MEALTQEQKLAVKEMSTSHSLYIQYTVEVEQGDRNGETIETRIRKAGLVSDFAEDLRKKQSALGLEIVKESNLIHWEDMGKSIVHRLKAGQAA